MNTDIRAEIEWFLFKCLVGAFPFLGWFILYYFGEMVLAWLPIVVARPEYAVPAAYVLQVPAAAFALRKAIKHVERWERGFWR
jgi:hypothetical protein